VTDLGYYTHRPEYARVYGRGPVVLDVRRLLGRRAPWWSRLWTMLTGR
jgi:hypothetical protein